MKNPEKAVISCHPLENPAFNAAAAVRHALPASLTRYWMTQGWPVTTTAATLKLLLNALTRRRYPGHANTEGQPLLG